MDVEWIILGGFFYLAAAIWAAEFWDMGRRMPVSLALGFLWPLLLALRIPVWIRRAPQWMVEARWFLMEVWDAVRCFDQRP